MELVLLLGPVLTSPLLANGDSTVTVSDVTLLVHNNAVLKVGNLVAVENRVDVDAC